MTVVSEQEHEAELPAVETLHVGILDRLSRSNKLQRDAACVRPLIERLAGKLGAIVAHERLRQRPLGRKRLERGDHPLATEAKVHDDRRTVASEVIHDRERAKHTAGAERVVDKIDRPPLGGTLRGRPHDARPHHPSAAAAARAAPPCGRPAGPVSDSPATPRASAASAGGGSPTAA